MMNNNTCVKIKRSSASFFSCIFDILLFPLFTQHILSVTTAESLARSKDLIAAEVEDYYLWHLITTTKAGTGNLTTVIDRLNFQLVTVFE
jgi:hypothetical protein